MTDRTSEDSFLEELERAAKGLSVVTDQASTDELRRLFGELQADGHAGDDAPAEDRRCDASLRQDRRAN